MSFIDQFRLLVASNDDLGEPGFIVGGEPKTFEVPNVFEAAWYWSVKGEHNLTTNIGGKASDTSVASSNGSTFGIARFASHSAGKLDVSEVIGESGIVGDDKSMHATNSIDYEFILSGCVDFVLPKSKRQTLKAGDFLVVTGVPHSWENIYDEDCVYLVVTIGARR